MILEERIRLGNTEYLFGVEVKYNDNGFLKKSDGSYFDCGDLGYLVKNVEKTYEDGTYYKNVGFINDIAFIYDRFPFISYIKDIYYDKDGYVTSTCMIEKKEIEKVIDKYNIKMGLFDGKESVCPLLFK
ncbi:MAG: hypothetical protein Q4E75_00605 [bacterium]|nr:hypothetical protein [bacterium]